MKKRTLNAIACAIGLLTLCGQALANDAYPAKPVRLVVPFAPGGATDVVARVIANKLAQQLGVAVVVDNKTGANGNLGAQDVARAQGDGYTLLYNTSSIVLSKSLYRQLAYDYARDFQPVIRTAKMPLAIAVPNGFPASNLQEFIDLMKKDPKRVSYGSGGIGNVSHLGFVQLLKATNVEATHVPYRGEGPGLADVMGGQTQAFLGTVPSVKPLVDSNRLKAIVVAGSSRSAAMPNVPSASEAGVPAFNVEVWQGILAPASTPAAIVTRLNAEIAKVLRDAEVKEKLAQQGVEAQGGTAAEYRAFMRSEDATWSDIIKSANITLD